MRVAIATKLLLLASLAVLLVLPSVAAAVLSGANGRIAYISGRGVTDAQAKLYLRVAAGSLGFGLNAGPMSTATGQHRHPTWSPDRTKIAYARGDSSCTTDCDIYVLDLTAPVPFAQNITNTANVTEDRPAWSPDGTRIAYESEVTNGSGQVDILVDPVDAGPTLNLTNSAGIEGKPAWTPDSTAIYYHTGNPAVANALDIVREPAGGGAVTPIAASPAVSEFQASLSPDGTQMCFTRGSGFNATADVIVSLANGGGQQDLSDDAVEGNYNCTWSPNGILVAYVTGIFSTGSLVMERADDTSPLPIELEAVPGVFDGNPDWAPDGRPVCEDVTVNTGFNQPVTVPLQCFDTGPFYERTPVQEFTSGQPGNGALGGIVLGDQEPSTVVYTPNEDFSGTDTFQYNAFDLIAGFATPPRTVTVNVAEPPQQQEEVDDPPPVLSNLTVSPRTWKLGARPPRLLAARVGTRIRWRLSEDAATTLLFQRALPGRRVGRRCVKPTRANRAKRRCRRFRRAGRLVLQNSSGGLNTLRFQGRLAGQRRLAPGRYRVAARAADSAGQQSVARFSSVFRALR